MVQKTVDILDYLSNNPKGATLSTIVRDLGFPKTTVYDILKILMINDFVQYSNPDKKIYCIGAQVYGIGLSYLRTSVFFRVARPYLVLLGDRYKKAAILSKRRNDRAILIYKYVPLNVKTGSGNVGDIKQLHSTSIGKCYLAFDPEAVCLIDTIDLPARTPYTITEREKLKQNIKELQDLGYSWERREDDIRMACLAAPIFKKDTMIGTISMSGRYEEDEDLTAQGNEILQLAKLISAQLEQEKNL